jgi:hypothetical protein
MISMLATGPTVCGFKLGRRDGFLRVIEICSMPASRRKVKPEAPCLKFLQHVKKHLGSMNKVKFIISSPVFPACC